MITRLCAESELSSLPHRPFGFSDALTGGKGSLTARLSPGDVRARQICYCSEARPRRKAKKKSVVGNEHQIKARKSTHGRVVRMALAKWRVLASKHIKAKPSPDRLVATQPSLSRELGP